MGRLTPAPNIGGFTVTVDTYDEAMRAGLDLVPLLALPIAALICGVAVAVGLFRRSPLLLALAVVGVLIADLSAMMARPASPVASSIDSLVALLPLALLLGAVPYLVKMTPAVLRSLFRRIPVREPAVAVLHAD